MALMLRTLLIAGLALASACGGTQTVPQAAQATAVVRIECSVKDAEIWLDSSFFREVADAPNGLRVLAGAHRIEIRHPDYHSIYVELELREGENKSLSVELLPKL